MFYPRHLSPCLLALAISPLLSAPAAFAQNELAMLDNVLVTATRTELDIDAVLAPVTVVTRSDIERLQATDITQLLTRSPGVDISRSGGPGSDTNLYLRGSNSNHTLFLVDGQRVGAATLGTTNIQFIAPEALERVEIVRGPRSSLYGSDAIGGVIQFFTRTPGEKPSAYVKAGYGNRNSQQLAAGGDSRVDQWRFGAYLNYYSTDGINNTISHIAPADDEDAFRNRSAVLKLGYDLDNGGAIDVGHFYTKAKNEYDISPTNRTDPYSESWISNTYAKLQLPVTDWWASSWSIARAQDDSDNFNKTDPTDRSDYRTTRKSASWQNDFRIDDSQTFTAGVDYYDDHVDSSVDYESTDGTVRSRDNVGYFAQYLLNGDVVDLQAALRQDDNEEFGDKTTGGLSVGFHLPRQHRLIFSYGTAFKAPTFNQLFWPLAFGSSGNPDLEPEESENYEVELRGDYQRWSWSFNVFRNDVDNLIDWAMNDQGLFVPTNVKDARLEGAELSVNTSWHDWLITANASYVDPEDKATGNLLPRRARRTASVDVDRRFGDWEVGAGWRVQDHRYDDVANRQRLAGYGLVNLRVGYHLSPAWLVQVKLDNVFDQDYSVRRNYQQEGFTWFTTVTYRM